MNLRASLRWLLFVGYVALWIALPGALLWNQPGLHVGLVLSALFLVAISANGTRRIAHRMRAHEISRAEAPILFTLVDEHSRRAGITPPHVGVIETPALNAATFGFSTSNRFLVVTEGTLKTLDREMLSALVARLITRLKVGGVTGHSWLSQFLSLFDRLSRKVTPRSHSHIPTGTHVMGARFYSIRTVIKQVLLYPLALVPAYVLQKSSDPLAEDLISTRLSRNPQALSEVFRLFEASLDRFPLPAAISCRHLFLLPPAVQDPVARIFFYPEEFWGRIGHIESLKKVVPLQT